MDFRLTNHGTICLLSPLTPAAHEWIDTYVHAPMYWADSLVIEPRYVDGTVNGIECDGLSVGGGY
jgi:hypothetical protein